MELPKYPFNLEKSIRSKSLKELKTFSSYHQINVEGRYTKENLRFTILKWFKENYGY